MHITNVDLPDFNERPNGKIDTLVFHCSTHDAPEMIEVLKSKQLSSHYIIGLDGKIFQTVADEKRAWHAGVSCWRGVENINHTSIGIEISSPTMGQEPYKKQQILSLIELSKMLIKKYDIPAANVVAHSDIAPTRKADPGRCFPWQEMAQHEIGLWYDLDNADKIKETDMKKLLSAIGYDVSNFAAAQTAFCRRFIPQLVAENKKIAYIEQHPFEKDFYIPAKYLPIVKACCYEFATLKRFL